MDFYHIANYKFSEIRRSAVAQSFAVRHDSASGDDAGFSLNLCHCLILSGETVHASP